MLLLINNKKYDMINMINMRTVTPQPVGCKIRNRDGGMINKPPQPVGCKNRNRRI